MSLPASGQISISDIRTELQNTGTTNFSLAKAGQISIYVNKDDGFVPINRASAVQPGRTNPYQISEWYSYNHSTSQACSSSTYTLPGYHQQYSLIKLNLTRSCGYPVFSSGITINVDSAGYVKYEEYSAGTVVNSYKYISSAGDYTFSSGECIRASTIAAGIPLTPVPSTIIVKNIGYACGSSGTTLTFTWTGYGAGEYSNQYIRVFTSYPFNSSGGLITTYQTYSFSGGSSGTQTIAYPNQSASDTIYIVGYYDNPQNGYPPTAYYTITTPCNTNYPSSTLYCLGYNSGSNCAAACSDWASCGNN